MLLHKNVLGIFLTFHFSSGKERHHVTIHLIAALNAKVNDIWVEIHYSQLKRYEALAAMSTTTQPNM